MAKSIITLDVETFFDPAYRLGKLTTLEYVADDRFHVHGWSIKVDNQPAEWVADNDVAIQEIFKAAKSGHSMLAHNVAFDGLILAYHHKILFDFHYDTMCMAQGLNPHGSASLANLLKLLFPTDESMRKGTELADFAGKRFLTEDENRALGDYCINDVEMTWAALQAMPWYPKSELELIDLTTKLWLRPRLRLDRDMVKVYQKELAEDKLRKVAATPYPKELFSSNDKFAAMIQNDLGLQPPTKISVTTGKKTWAFSKNDLPYIQFCAANPEHAALWSARTAVKSTQEDSRSKRLLKAAELDDGWLRVPLKYAAAHTLRFGGTEKLNLQNLGRGSTLRKALTAPDGHVINVRDLSQIEPRINATLSGQQDLIDQYTRGDDVYSLFASAIYNRPVNRKRMVLNSAGQETFPDFTEGFVGKTGIIGLGYQMGALRFQQTLAIGATGPAVHIPLLEAKRIVNVYRKKNHKIKDFWDQCDRFLFDMACPNTKYEWSCLEIQKGRIVLPSGMALNYPGLHYDETPTGFQWQYKARNGWTSIYGGKLCENIIQALARIVITDNMLAIEKALDGAGNVVLNVHDEILTVTKEAFANDADKIMGDIMSAPPSWLPTLPVASEGGWAKNYSK